MKKTPSPTPNSAVAARAYQLWEQADRPDGRSQEFWLLAEQQLQAEALPPAIPSASPSPAPQAPALATPPVIREAVQAIARPTPPAPSRKHRTR